MNQLQIHKKIDRFFKTPVKNARVKLAVELVGYNEDAKRYFFTVASEQWLKWIWDNNLLNKLKEKAIVSTTYSYRLPELDYLNKMSEKEPQLVADIILSIPISETTFNPEVIDRFFWITGQLPSEQVKLILPKILEDKWLKLMVAFRRSGYDYQRIVTKLVEAKDYNSLITLSKIILMVHTKEEVADSKSFSLSDKIFYLHDITATGIFDAITDEANNKKEDSLRIFLDTLTQIVGLGTDRDESIFEKIEPFYLLDVNIFTLDIEDKHGHSREDIQNFIATCKELIREVLQSKQENESEVKRVYTSYVSTLPDSLTCWRLKLYAVTRYPSLFKNEIQKMLFRVFNVGEKHHELDSGAEYHEGLIAGFGALDEPIQREYVRKVIEYYGASLSEKKIEQWRKRDGLEILTLIKKYLKPEEITKAESTVGKFSGTENFTPQPTIRGGISSGIISPKSPVKIAELTIEKLIEYLKTEGSPETLDKKFEHDDFFSPRGAEGLGDAIKDDFKKRKSEYLPKINLFFDRDAIFPGYIYSLLRGIEEAIRAKETFTNEQYLQVINFFELIKKSGDEKEFEKSKERSYLSDWITVHKIAADILLEILAIIKDNNIFKENRSKILGIIKYFLSIKSSPDAEDEKTENESEPSHVAINSVRGQAYRAFVQFAYNEGSKGLSDDVKVLYEHVLDTDSSSAVRFTIGQFLASFYFRDIKFIKNILPKIFPKEQGGKEKLYLSTWEGYLSSSLYKELFAELKPYYKYAISVNPESYPNRKHSSQRKGLDETLAIHLSLAFIHFDFSFESPLFKLFWSTANENRHYEFVSFIGRSCINQSQASQEWFKEHKVSKDKLIKFWDWILRKNFEPKAYSGFGFWINPQNEIIDEKIIIKNLPATLKKSKGEVDWDYGLIHRLTKFAEIDPTSTLKVIQYFLLLGHDLNPHRGVPLFSIDHEIKDTLEIIYKNPKLKTKVRNFVDLLITKGSSVFWGLKAVL